MEAYDVIVLGGGSSGMMAACAAAREGASVLLIEKNGSLGGTNTTALVCPLMTFHGEGKQIVAGLAQQVVDRLAALGGTLGHIPDPLGVTDSITPIEPSLLAQVYFAMLAEYPSLHVRLHTLLTGVHRKGERIESVTCVDKSGAHEYCAHTYIDASGDGDMAAMAGAAFRFGRPEDGFAQPMSMLFKIRHVDFAAIRAYMQAHPEQFVLREGAMDAPYTAVSGFFAQVAQAQANGEFHISRDRVLMFQGVREDEAIVNMTRVIKKSGIKADELTQAEIEAHRQLDEIVAFLRKYIPGCEKIDLAECGGNVGIRESRRFVGQYELQEADIHDSRTFEDSIACCGFPIDIHSPVGASLDWRETKAGGFYDVPYRVMLPVGRPNLLITGRCVSATHEALASVRITATAMAMGEAAGIAAAMAAVGRTDAPYVSVSDLQTRIADWGGIPGRRFLEKRSPLANV